jgi:hypothetical protein
MNNMSINYRDQIAVRKLGMEALRETLGNVGAIYFIRQWSTGSGDYTKDRTTLHAELTFEDIVKGSMEMDAKRTN